LTQKPKWLAQVSLLKRRLNPNPSEIDLPITTTVAAAKVRYSTRFTGFTAPATATRGDGVVISARLEYYDTIGQRWYGVALRRVSLQVIAPDGTQSFLEATTDTDGWASFAKTVDQTGTYSWTVIFAGDDTFDSTLAGC